MRPHFSVCLLLRIPGSRTTRALTLERVRFALSVKGNHRVIHSSAPTMMRVVRQRNFALLWTAGLASLLGDWAFYTIMPVFVLDQTGSVFLAGIVWAVIALPSVVVGPVAGVYADRWDRRKIMLWGNVAQATAATLLAVGGAGAGIWVAMTVMLVNASLAALILPAENALLPALVRAEELGPANALNAMNDNLGRILGPPVGALVYARFGIEVVAAVNAMSFLVAALLVQSVRASTRSLSVAVSGSEPFWWSLRAGAGVVRRSRLLGVLFLILGLVAFADGPLAAMITPFVDTTLGEGAEGVGVFATVRGVAGILGGIVIGQFGHRVREERLLVVSAALNGLGFAAMALVQNFAFACVVLLVVIGPTHIGLHTTLTTLLQRGSEDAHRGRVFALAGALTGALFLVGTLGGSAAGGLLSPAAVIIGSGMLFLGAALATAVFLPAALASLAHAPTPAFLDDRAGPHGMAGGPEGR
jgi:predicted MFS family arabinose efflux permease